MAEIVLHDPQLEQEGTLKALYVRAITKCTRLYIVSAYLTAWGINEQLSSGCRDLRFIVGKDFGLTRKQACQDVLDWLPPNMKMQFLVADKMSGFHPKAIFWSEGAEKFYCLIGSSNLTWAAFNQNYEANAFFEITKDQFSCAMSWIAQLEKQSVPISPGWLERYKEAVSSKGGQSGDEAAGPDYDEVIVPPPFNAAAIKRRRKQLAAADASKSKRIEHFRRVANGQISNTKFYDGLSAVWGSNGDRIQGKGWERQGSKSNFSHLARWLLSILDADKTVRDQLVADAMDSMARQGNSARRAFFSEMLCLSFPDLYPIMNRPVQRYIRDQGVGPPRGSSEGSAYVDLSRKLRSVVLRMRKHSVRNIAELDALIWLQYNP